MIDLMEDVAALMDRYPRLTRRPGVLLAILMRSFGYRLEA